MGVTGNKLPHLIHHQHGMETPHGNTWTLVAYNPKEPRRGRLSWYINMYIYIYLHGILLPTNDCILPRGPGHFVSCWEIGIFPKRGFEMTLLTALQGEITLLPIYYIKRHLITLNIKNHTPKTKTASCTPLFITDEFG